MNVIETRQYQMLVRVRDFSAAYGHLFPEGGVARQLLTTVSAAVTQLDVHTLTHTTASISASSREKAELRDTLLARLQTISQTARVMIADTPGIDHQFQLPEVMSEEVMLTAGRRFARDAERFLGAFIAHGLPGTLTSDLTATVDAFERASRVKGMSRDERVAARTNMKAALSAGISAVRRLHVIVMNHLTNDEATRTVWDRDRRVVYPERKRAAASRATAPESNPAAATPAAAVTA